jgi:outer membrane protein assembly factor BamB
MSDGLRRARTWRRAVIAMCLVLVIAGAAVAGLLLSRGGGSGPPASGQTTGSLVAQATSSSSTSSSSSSSTELTTTTIPTVDMTVAPAAGTTPAALDLSTGTYVNGEKVTSYARADPIDFGAGNAYTSLPGIITFRGNNYRDSPSYGTADVALGKLVLEWSVPSGSVPKTGGEGSWTGSGWTGQPLIVKWPEDTKQIMNLKETKKADPDLVEVIYPCLDGRIYFLDLTDGTATRPVIESGGGPFKGTGSLYPDGTPMLFVGHGDGAPNREPVKARLYSLIDQKQLYSFGTKPDALSFRSFHAYDSSALFDVESDTIIEPGENGILYTIKLNTKFDKTAGTLSVDPEEPVRLRYTAPNYSVSGDNSPEHRWWGMEDSAVTWRNYLYVTDNGGKLMCFDLNTMKLVWAQDVLDDTNSTPVFEESPKDGTCYIYISTSLHITATGSEPRKGGIPIWKIDAATGEIVWKTPDYPCYTISGVSGGVQATPVLGKEDIENLVIYPIARTPGANSGILVALDKKTGAEVWKTEMVNYAWSSPLAVYTPEGKSYIVQCDSVGTMFLLEGTTGKVLSTLDLETNIEASPAAFGDMIVVGTRGERICGVRIE